MNLSTLVRSHVQCEGGLIILATMRRFTSTICFFFHFNGSVLGSTLLSKSVMGHTVWLKQLDAWNFISCIGCQSASKGKHDKAASNFPSGFWESSANFRCL